MNILIVTGRLAESTVKKAVKNEADVLVLNIEVAAFITPSLLKKYIPVKKYDIILIPGLASGDFTELEKELDTPIRLGPKHAVDLDFVLSYADDTPFSKQVPACELLMEKRRSNALEKVSELETGSSAPLTIGDVKIGSNSRMKIMAEIVDAGHLKRDELINKISYFQNIGADIIDLGMSLDTTPEDARNAVTIARESTDLPVSIDTLDPDLINAALSSGADIVLSLNSENIPEVKDSINKNSAIAVIIPDCVDDLESLFHNIEKARNSGMKNIIADPVLEPVGQGITGSINRYYEFRKRDPSTPLFFGVGNVTELIDADSIGINAILAGIAMELDASILFTPDYSHKTHNGVSELRTASMMMMLSGERMSAPKDLGLDLLAIKEKRRREFGKITENPVLSKANEQWHLDPSGCFKLNITPDEIRKGKLNPGKIVAEHKTRSITGNTAKEVLDTLIRLGLVSHLDHAAYLGRELMKAELALKFKRSYSQDDEF